MKTLVDKHLIIFKGDDGEGGTYTAGAVLVPRKLVDEATSVISELQREFMGTEPDSDGMFPGFLEGARPDLFESFEGDFSVFNLDTE
jgi:hypothetical protein